MWRRSSRTNPDVALNSLPSGNVVHGATEPVQAKDELVPTAAIIATGYADDVLPVLAIDIDGIRARGDARGLATSRRLGCCDGLAEEAKDEHNDGERVHQLPRVREHGGRRRRESSSAVNDQS